MIKQNDIMKNKPIILAIAIVIILNIFCVVYFIINKNDFLNNLSLIFFILSVLAVIFVLVGIFEIYLKQKKIKNIVKIFHHGTWNKYLTMSFACFMIAMFSFRVKSPYTFSGCIMLLAMSLLHFVLYKSNYYLSDEGIFWAGRIFLWKDAEFYQVDTKKSVVEVRFRNSPRLVFIPYNEKNQTEIEEVLSEYIANKISELQ